MEHIKEAVQHFAADLFEYITVERETGDLALAFKLSQDLNQTRRELVKVGEEGAKDYRNQGDEDIAEQGERDADLLGRLEIKSLVSYTVEELGNYAEDAADVLAALIKSLNS